MSQPQAPVVVTQPQVFVSYASADREQVVQIVRRLEAQGITVWRDGDHVLGGQYHGELIVHAIAHSKVVLLMCSPEAFRSDNVHREVLLTWDYYHRTYLPVWLAPPSEIPEQFRNCLAGCQWFDAHDQPAEQWLPRMVQALARLGVGPAHDSAPPRTELAARMQTPPTIPSVVEAVLEVLPAEPLPLPDSRTVVPPAATTRPPTVPVAQLVTRPGRQSPTQPQTVRPVRPVAAPPRPPVAQGIAMEVLPAPSRWHLGCMLATLLFLLVTLGAGGYFGYSWYQGRATLRELQKRVDDLIEANETDEALVVCDEAVRWNPRASDAYCERGRVLAERHEYDRAIQDFDEAIRLDTNNALAHARRGRTFAFKKDYDRAFTDCDAAVRLNPRLARAYVNRAYVLKQKKNLMQAIHDMDEAVRLAPTEVYYNARGEFYEGIDMEMALKDYDESLRIKPTAAAYINRADIYLRKSDVDASMLDRAIADCTEALQLNPTRSSAYGIRGSCYVRKKDCDRAETDLTEAIRIDRQYAYAYRNRGQLYLDQKDYTRARADYQAAADLDTDQWPYDVNNAGAAQFGLAKQYLAQGKYNEAAEANDRAIELRCTVLQKKPWWWLARWSRSDNYAFRGEIHARQNDFPRAAEWYQKASDDGNKTGSEELAKLYETGKGVARDAARARKLRQRAAGQVIKRFTIPCLMQGYSKRVPLWVYVTTPLGDRQDDPIAEEANRLHEENNATIPDDVRDSFKRLLKIAREKNVSFPDLCVYALGEASKDSKKKGEKNNKQN